MQLFFRTPTSRTLLTAAMLAVGSFGLTACDGSESEDDDDFGGNPEELLIEATVSPAGGAAVEYTGFYSLSGLDGANMGDLEPDGSGVWSVSDEGVSILIDIEVPDGQEGGVSVEVKAAGEVVETRQILPGEDEIVLYSIPD